MHYILCDFNKKKSLYKTLVSSSNGYWFVKQVYGCRLKFQAYFSSSKTNENQVKTDRPHRHYLIFFNGY